MLSYRHAYHAGNFADVMKHVVLTALLKYLTRKHSALCYIDTHAGAGGYDLQSEYSQKTAESSLGISRLWGVDDAPQPVSDYLDLVHRYNPAGDLAKYPGSPWIAAELLRPQDRLMLCELHSSDFPRLEELFANDRRVHCYAENGHRFSVGLVPPTERRGLILMDPAYELRDELETAVAAVSMLRRRFATGTYALWYPILHEGQTAALRRRIENLRIRDVLHLALTVAHRESIPGMYGCAVIVINPPWTLRGTMEVALPYLASKLGRNNGATCHIEQWVEE
jgi:23S rRNA (adenine2030-N6)-methyltransferase